MNTEKIKNILLTTLSVFLVVATVFGSVFMAKSLGWFKQPTIISISGSGKVTYKPDLAEISVSVITKEKDSETVQLKNDEKMAAIIGYLKDSGVKEEDIKTISYNLYPEYQQGPEAVPMSSVPGSPIVSSPEYYYPNTFKIIGYTLDQSLSFKVRDISRVGAIVGGLSDKGANQVSGISFSLSDEKTEELKAEAREKAVEKAKKELEITKSLYGFKKAKLLSINDYPVYPSVMYQDMKALGAGGKGAPSNVSPIEAGTGELEVQVNLTYELR